MVVTGIWFLAQRDPRSDQNMVEKEKRKGPEPNTLHKFPPSGSRGFLIPLGVSRYLTTFSSLDFRFLSPQYVEDTGTGTPGPNSGG